MTRTACSASFLILALLSTAASAAQTPAGADALIGAAKQAMGGAAWDKAIT